MSNLSDYVCWRSSQESINKGKISILSILEVYIGIWLYWRIIPEFIDGYWHIWLSILIAPLLLLKSKQSNEMALKLMRYSLHRSLIMNYYTIIAIIIVLFSYVGIGYLLSSLETIGCNVLNGEKDLQNAVRDHLSEGMSYHLVLSLIGTIIYSIIFIVVFVVFIMTTFMLALLYKASILMGLKKEIAIFCASSMVTFLLIVNGGIHAFFTPFYEGSVFKCPAYLIGYGNMLFVVFSIVILSFTLFIAPFIVVKGVAIIFNIKSGLLNFDKNFYEVIAKTDCYRPAELIYGIEHDSKLKDLRVTKAIADIPSPINNSVDLGKAGLGIIRVMAFSIMGYLYRFNLKASSLLYLPLILSIYGIKRDLPKMYVVKVNDPRHPIQLFWCVIYMFIIATVVAQNENIIVALPSIRDFIAIIHLMLGMVGNTTEILSRYFILLMPVIPLGICISLLSASIKTLDELGGNVTVRLFLLRLLVTLRSFFTFVAIYISLILSLDFLNVVDLQPIVHLSYWLDSILFVHFNLTK